MISKKKIQESQLVKVFDHLRPKRRTEIIYLSLLMVFSSFLEAIGIGSIVPFLAALSNPRSEYVQNFFIFWNFEFHETSDSFIIIMMTVVFTSLITISSLVRVFVVWKHNHLSAAIGSDLSADAFRATVFQDYSSHLRINSSDVLSGTQKARDLSDFLIYPAMMIFSSILTSSFIFLTLIYVEPFFSLLIFLVIGLFYFLIFEFTKSRMKDNSRAISTNHSASMKIQQETLGGIRDLIVNDIREYYTKKFSQSFVKLQSSLATNRVLGATPKFFVEAFGTVVIAFVAMSMALTADRQDFSEIIPILGVIALSGQRLLPCLQNVYSSLVIMNGNKDSNSDALHFLTQPVVARNQSIKNKKIMRPLSISLSGAEFCFPDASIPALSDVNFTINDGERIGIIGETGSGKTTLLNLLLGLLVPTSGDTVVNKIRITKHNSHIWQSFISYVPQNTFFLDDTISNNIAFGSGFDVIDQDRIEMVAKTALIHDTIAKFPDGYNTVIGERGARLSGGQLQRLAIARALYREKPIIIFDEATSALDINTEKSIFESIMSVTSNCTLVFVTHRPSTLIHCDKVFLVANRTVTELKAEQYLNGISDLGR